MATAPTAADVDSLADSYYSLAPNLYLGTFEAEATQTRWLAAYTQNDSTVAAIVLPSDPTADFESASICRGLVVSYTNILVREYVCAWSEPGSVADTVTTTFIADSTEQARVNNPSNWVTAP